MHRSTIAALAAFAAAVGSGSLAAQSPSASAPPQSASATAASAPTVSASEPVVIGSRMMFRSKLLGAEYPVVIHRPAGYDQSTEKYPVLYMLDGDGHFHHASGAVAFLAANGRIPPMIVVGIGNSDRTRDLTPPTADPAMRQGSGGADRFLQFISDEIVPYVEANNRTIGHRVLAGHSFGGLFALHALVTRPELFNGYIVISPSVWWNGEAVVNAMPRFLEEHEDLRASVYMTTGNEGGPMLTGAQRLAGIFEEKAPPRFRWEFRHMPDESHGSIPHRTLYDGLEVMFRDLRLESDSTSRTVADLEARYERLSDRFGYQIPVTEAMINRFGYTLLVRELHAEAIAAFRTNTERYPESANTFDSLGDGYVAAGDLPNARSSFARAVELARRNGDPVLQTSATKLANVTATLDASGAR